MKPFLTPEQALEIEAAFWRTWSANQCNAHAPVSDLRAALAKMTIAPPKPKFRVGQYVVAIYGTPAQITEVVETGGKTLYRTRDGCSWSGDVLRPLTTAEIEGPKEGE